MEVITVLLSSLLLIISPVGVVVDHVAEDAIRSRLAGAESLDVRIDNGPSHQLLQGRVDKVRIAGRGLLPVPELRIDIAELETDAIDLDFRSLRQGEVVLDEPFQGAVRLVLTESDLNRFLNSERVLNQLSQFNFGGLNPAQAREGSRYQVNSPQLSLLDDNRIRLAANLRDQVEQTTLAIEVETGLTVAEGDRLMLVDPALSIDGEPTDPRVISLFLGDINNRLSLSRFDDRGITARVLDLSVDDDRLDLAFWLRLDPQITNRLVDAR